jgi:cardiolipin synthase
MKPEWSEQASRTAVHEVEGNRLVLIPDGRARLAALLDLIAGAQDRLDLYFYIVAADDASTQVRDALIDACGRGTKVTLLVDAFGTALTADSFFAPLIQAGARFGRFGKRRSTRYLIRNHQKMAIADGKCALFGGFNISRNYFSAPDARNAWRDMGIRIEGPLAGDLLRWFDALAHWTMSERQSFRTLRKMVREWQPGPQKGRLRWLMGGPTLYLNGWARSLKQDLQVGKRLDMAAAFFSPSRGIVTRLCRVASRGSVDIVLPMRTDNPVSVGASRHLYRRMLEGGISFGEFRPQRLHAKLIAIDDIAYVGSANFDMRSLFLNVELMLRVEDAAFAEAVRCEIAAMRRQARHIDWARWRRMASPFARARWWLQYLLVGVLDYTVTRRLNLFRARRD